MREAAARSDTRSRRLEPRLVAVPDPLMAELDRLVALVSARTGEPPEDVRRGVEVSVLTRGIAALKGEEGLR